MVAGLLGRDRIMLGYCAENAGPRAGVFLLKPRLPRAMLMVMERGGPGAVF